MKSSNRDLLVLVKDDFESEQAMQSTLHALNEMLFHAESYENCCLVNEIIDLNRYKIYSSPEKMMKVLQQPNLKPFQFICNKN
jgi:hypothetical protein